jgi:hypothetical protein
MDQDIEQLERRCDYLQQQIETLSKNLEDAKRPIEEKEPEFDFRKLMPVGSIWLGNETFKVIGSLDGARIPKFGWYYSTEKPHKEIYFAHQIVKEVQRIDPHYLKGWPYVDLNKALKEAEKAGVLQNLE